MSGHFAELARREGGIRSYQIEISRSPMIAAVPMTMATGYRKATEPRQLICPASPRRPTVGNAMTLASDDEDTEPVDSWLGPEFLEDVLRQALKDPKLEVVRGKVWPDEEHFAGDGVIVEAQVRYVWAQWAASDRHGEVSLVVKAEPGGEDGRALRRLRLFAKERRVYASALPDMTRLYERAYSSAVQRHPPLAPRFFPCSRHDALVIQNVTADGFRAADMSRGLDLQHCYSALEALAQFHARSVALRHQRPDALLDFRESFFTADNESLADTLEPALGALASAVDTWSGYERFGDKIRQLQKTAVARMVETMKPDGARPLVLNHGDFWTGSLLFLYDELGGLVKEVRLINFQLARWGSPALDLQFFLYSSPSEEVRAKSGDRLLASYHGALASALAGLKCFGEVPSLEQLRGEMAEKALVGALAALCVLGRVMSDPNSSGDEVHGAKYRAALQRMLPIFEEQGVL